LVTLRETIFGCAALAGGGVGEAFIVIFPEGSAGDTEPPASEA
jgi:hypothetical protein